LESSYVEMVSLGSRMWRLHSNEGGYFKSSRLWHRVVW